MKSYTLKKHNRIRVARRGVYIYGAFERYRQVNCLKQLMSRLMFT